MCVNPEISLIVVLVSDHCVFGGLCTYPRTGWALCTRHCLSDE